MEWWISVHNQYIPEAISTPCFSGISTLACTIQTAYFVALEEDCQHTSWLLNLLLLLLLILRDWALVEIPWFAILAELACQVGVVCLVRQHIVHIPPHWVPLYHHSLSSTVFSSPSYHFHFPSSYLGLPFFETFFISNACKPSLWLLEVLALDQIVSRSDIEDGKNLYPPPKCERKVGEFHLHRVHSKRD